MLRKDVIEACAAGRFAVYPIAAIDQGIELLNGLIADGRGFDGTYLQSPSGRSAPRFCFDPEGFSASRVRSLGRLAWR
jgi:hypothetical protein